MNPLKHKLANEWMRQDDASPEEALETWNTMEAEFKLNRAMLQEPRTMAQEPRNMYNQGQLVRNTVDGSRPGYNGKKVKKEDIVRRPLGSGKYSKDFFDNLLIDYDKYLEKELKTNNMSKTKSFRKWLDQKYSGKTTGQIFGKKTSSQWREQKLADTASGNIHRRAVYYDKNFYKKATDALNNKKNQLLKNLVTKANASDKIIMTQTDIMQKLFNVKPEHVSNYIALDWVDSDLIKNLDLKEDKVNKALDNIILNDELIKAPKKIKKAYDQSSILVDMIKEKSGVSADKTIRKGLDKNLWYQKNKDAFKYLSKIHIKDFIGKSFSEAFDFASERIGGMVKISGVSRFDLPDRQIWSHAMRHYDGNHRTGNGKNSLIKLFDNKGNPIKWEDLPKDEKGRKIIDSSKVQFKYKNPDTEKWVNKLWNRKTLALDGAKSGLFDEVYKSVGEFGNVMKRKVPDPNNLNKMITFRELLEATGEKYPVAVGHSETLGGVKGSPFKNLTIMSRDMNQSLFHAYNEIKNKDIRKKVVNSIFGDLKGLKGKAYLDAFVNNNTERATNIITGKVSAGESLYRTAGKEIIEQAGSDFPKWGPEKQTEALRIAGIDLSKPEGRLKFRQIGTVKVLNKILERNNIKICNDELSNGKGVVCGTKFAERDPNAFLEAIKRNKDATKIINKPGLVKGALKGLSGWAKKELGPMGWIGSIATIDSAFGLYALGQGKTPLQALDETLWFLPKSWIKADEKMFKNVYENAGYTQEDFGEFQKWMKLEDLDQQYFASQNQLEFMQGQVLEPEKKSAADIAYQKEVDALPDAYKDKGWNRPLFAITSEEEKTMEHPFYGPAVDRHNKIVTESQDVYKSLKAPEKSQKDLDYTRKLAAMEQANRKKKLMRESLKYNPDLIPLFDPFSKLGPKEMKDQSFLYDEYVHPIEGPSVSPEQMRAAGFAAGGLAGLMKKYYD